MPMTPYPPMRERPATIQREFRGVNKLDAFSIADVFATETENLTSTAYPAVTTRPGYSVVGQYGSKVLGLGVWMDDELHAVFDDGTWRRLESNGSWTQLATGLSVRDWTFTNFKSRLFGANGLDGIKEYDGNTVSSISDAPSGAKYITTYQNRLWCVAAGELHASKLDDHDVWSEYATPSTTEDLAFGKEIETPTGEEMNFLSGSLSKLTIGTPGALIELYGGVPSNFQDRPVTYDVGVANVKSAVTIDGTLMLLGRKGIYQYSGGTLPVKRFSEVVQQLVDEASTKPLEKSCVGTDGQMLYISLPSSGATSPDTILVYDTMRGSWYVWKGIQAMCFARVGQDFYIGDSQGRILKLNGSTDGGNTIAWKWVSKPFTGDSLAQKMRWSQMWLTLDLPVGSTLTAYLSPSATGDDWVQSGVITGSSSIQRKAVYLKSNIFPPTENIRLKLEGTGPCTIYEFARKQDFLPMR